jgi:methylated-DNA-[protein]-cysteine S-methyltransferase
MGVDDEAVIDSPVGRLRLKARGDALASVDFLDDAAERREPRSPFLRAAVGWLHSYFQEPGMVFDLALSDAGTAHQRAVWTALRAIPPGEVHTYAQLARLAGGSARSVAAACKANPWPIIVPCHRVIARDGLGGYCGTTRGRALETKRWLLRHEGWRGVDGGE